VRHCRRELSGNGAGARRPRLSGRPQSRMNAIDSAGNVDSNIDAPVLPSLPWFGCKTAVLRAAAAPADPAPRTLAEERHVKRIGDRSFLYAWQLIRAATQPNSEAMRWRIGDVHCHRYRRNSASRWMSAICNGRTPSEAGP
jgi:hypothetical protein